MSIPGLLGILRPALRSSVKGFPVAAPFVTRAITELLAIARRAFPRPAAEGFAVS
jgi:hypothetical protein